MTAPNAPRIVRATSVPLVWIVPLVALVLGGWMIIRTLVDRGPEITIDFADGSGVEAGKTQLKHKGGTAGTVTAVDLKSDLSGVTVRLRLTKLAAPLARSGGRFWIVRPKIGLSGVSGLDTLLSGIQLEVRPGSGPPAKHFIGLEKAPPPAPSHEGRTFLLQADRLGSLNPGSPVYYREVKVGEVEASRLADDAASVVVRIQVEKPYMDLVRNDTRFWNAGGFSFKVSLLGAELKNTSLESLVNGGVAFATPEPTDKNAQLAPVAAENAVFRLAAEPEKEWLGWLPKIPIHPEETGPDQAAPPPNLPAALTEK